MTKNIEIVGKVTTLDEALHTEPAPVEITLEEAKQFLAEAVAEKGPEYVYKNPTDPRNGMFTCAYFDPETKAPSCIVGHVLDRKGVPFERLDGRSRNLYTDVQGLIDAAIIEVDNQTQALLDVAQCAQDDGETWGASVQKALEKYKERAEKYADEGSDDPSEDYWF